MLVGMISQIYCFSSLSLDFSQLHFKTPPVLKINCLFNFFLQAHSFLLICFTQVFFFVAAAKSLQSCPTLCDPIDGSPPGSAVPGILQARTPEWVAILC